MPDSTRLRLKRGDTAPQFRAQCRGKVYDTNGAQVGTPGADGLTPVDLTGATARLLMRSSGGAAQSLALVVEPGVTGWVRHDWTAQETATAASYRSEVEVTFPDGRKQTFPADGYVTVEIITDLG